MKLLISKSGRFISKHLQNRSNPYEGKVARRMNENTIPERTHGEITRKENAVIPRDYSVYGTPEQARTAGVPLRRSPGRAFYSPLKSSKILDFTGFSEILVLINSLLKSANFTPFFPFILARY